MIPFLKMHGAGNDFVVIDNRKSSTVMLDWKKIADRNFGIGCDQVVIIEASERADVRMRIFNADGSEAQSCGNASRCVAWLVDKEKAVTIETLGGIIEAHSHKGNQVTVDMGIPRLEWSEIPLAEERDTFRLRLGLEVLKDPCAVNMGNPHMVFFVPNVESVPLDRLGPSLSRHTLFPEGANVNVAQVNAKDKITLRVWERGAGLTLACGTGACATLVAAQRRGLTGRKAEVKLPGGTLIIEWRESDNHVLMTGPVSTSFEGTFNPESYRS